MKRLAALAAIAICGACVMAPPVLHNNVADLHCDESKWVPFDAVGSGIIEGQAFLRTRGGEVRTAAGSEVILIPSVGCVLDWWAKAGKVWSNRNFLPNDPSFRARIRRTIADGDGRFRFDGLPAGPYIVRSQVTWEVPGLYGAGSTEIQGGIVGDEFQVEAGKATTAVLTW